MFGTRKTVVLCSAALLVACEPVSEPGVDPPLPTLHQARGAVASSVVGSGHFLVNGELRNFSFTALEIGGLVDGQFEGTRHDDGRRLHGIITCFLIVGDNANEALIGGRVTQARRFGGDPVGLDVVFRVVDNGPPGTTPDQISFLVTPSQVGDGSLATAADFCGPPAPEQAFNLPVFNLVRGNLTVHDNPPEAPNP